MQSGLGRDMAGRVTARLLERPHCDWVIAGGGDAPLQVVDSAGKTTDIAIGLSHSGGTVAVAAARGVAALGIDVQEIAQREFAALGAFMDWTDLLDTDDDAASKFAHLWTLWEATVKCEEKFLLTASNPAFDALSAAGRPGVAGSWSADAWWALSIRPTPACWLTLVMRNIRFSTPAVQIWCA